MNFFKKSYFGGAQDAQGGRSFGRSSKSSIGCPLGELREGDLLREKSA